MIIRYGGNKPVSDTDFSNDSPKGPKGRLITGHSKEFTSDTLGFLTRLANEYGEVAKFVLDLSKMFTSFQIQI